ncbi:exosome complex component RRP42 isoform X5 [Bubalus kerabau]|uniref:exosome complex component RRP42 isoform X5 n=1 Tax=Bubalus bubalis TaxID=89462 RepID=UPI001D10214C|nr:exosome complex component RRP42 isoform X5 [Bubalus bubalis]XP_055413059.1 exosome complex component RRP42 isoform X5 [Bubalus carabanensis]
MASVALSEAEKVYIVHGVQEDLRVDGRGCEDYRCVEVETDVVSNTSGSARVKLGHTDILVGVKAEMGTPKLEKPNEGYLEFFVDWIPRVRVLEDEEGSKDIELSDDPYDCIQLSVENVPCIVTLCKIGYRHVVDATLQEEACSLASLLVSVTSKGVVTCMRKVGKGSLDPESIFEMLEHLCMAVTSKTLFRLASAWARCCMPPCRVFYTRRRAWGPRDRKSDSWADVHSSLQLPNLCLLLFPGS